MSKLLVNVEFELNMTEDLDEDILKEYIRDIMYEAVSNAGEKGRCKKHVIGVRYSITNEQYSE